MRILASNPDTLGDLVLRQPMYRALERAGHELLLVVRRGVEPLVRYVAPSARTLVLPGEVYSNDLGARWEEFEGVFAAAREFGPDVLLVAPYRWTLFEERLSEALPGEVRRVGMSGHLYAGDPHAGAAPASALRFAGVADVSEEWAEVEKNAALCAAVLGRPPEAVDPRLEAEPAALESAARALARLGLDPGGYWVACVGGTAHVSIKTWPSEHWGRVLAEWARRYARKFLFVGLPDERPAAEAVRAAMAGAIGEDAAARHAALWMESDGTLDELLALTQLSAGYVGHDTGPMHVAAAMGKPTLAVFGGGTWPRFRPAVSPSVALTVGVPCVGCGWACSFSTSHCIKQVPPEQVLAALADLESGRVTGREARVLDPGPALLARMTAEAAAYVRQQVRERATVANRLRDLERAIVPPERTEWGAALRAELQAAREEAHRAAEAAEQRAAETALVRQDLNMRASEAARLEAALAAQKEEVSRLRDDIRGIVRDLQHAGGNGKHPPDTVMDTATPTSVAAAPEVLSEAAADAAAVPPSTDAGDDEVGLLRVAIQRLEARVRELQPPPASAATPLPPVRRSLREILVNLVIGSRYYPRRPAPPLPRVTLVTPVFNAAGAIRQTIESVLSQDYHPVQYVIVDGGSTDGTAEVLREYEGRVDRIVTCEQPPGEARLMDAVADAFARADGEVLGILPAGDVLEHGGVARVADYFARHRGVNAVYFEDAVLHDGGWKFPAPPQPTADVYHLLRLAREGRRLADGVYFRRAAYRALGPMDGRFGRAADWELWARLARRFELRRLEGHVRSVRADRLHRRDPAYAADLDAARQAFERGFGAAGRVRCRLIHAANRVFDAARARRPRQRLSFPLGAECRNGRPMPPADSPAPWPGQPACPLCDQAPDRLLFSTRDTAGGDRSIQYVYYDSSCGVAVAYPPLPRDRHAALYAARAERPPEVVPPDPQFRSPYARFGRGGLAELLQRLPSPWWWFDQPDFGDPTGDEVLRVLARLVEPDDSSIRLLNAGCFDGGVLDKIKAQTRWQLAGAETNASAAARARAKGHVVWDVAPQDAPLAFPVDEAFDVVALTNAVEHLQNPLLVLRRLRQVLRPGGLLVLNLPNLDSAHADLFGPTWGHWQVPYHRTLMGRRALKRLAMLADLEVVALRTRTFPYPACVSVQLNELGLGAVVPDTARFSNEIASRGVRLTGWSRLLWDWRGRGDYLFAVLRSL
jgi:ADP-heptose:LPS heptosyltransferase/SAM-dependent methyltransferase